MNCILHIGTEKTGTSTIQAFLDLNRSLLRSHKILFTESAGKWDDRGLSVAAYNSSNLDDYVKSLGLRTAEELSKYQRKMVDSLAKEITRSQKEGVETVVFSSEHLHSRLRTEEELERLLAILRTLGFEKISVIIYLRDQAETVSSLYNTGILYGGRTRLPPEPGEEKYWDNLCDHRESLQRFGKVFGAASVKPCLFIKEHFVDDSLVMDFLHSAGIDLPKESLKFPERENESISAFALEVLRRLNMRQAMFLDDGRLNPIRDGAPQLFQAVCNQGKKFKISPELATRYDEAYRSSNEWVREEFFPERETLFPVRSQEDAAEYDLDDREIDQLAELLNAFLLEKSKGGETLSVRELVSLITRKVGRKVKSLAGRFAQRAE